MKPAQFETQEPVALEQERKAFEEWIDSGFINKGHAAFHKFSDRDAYCIDEIQNKWKAWKERAKRTSPPPQRTWVGLTDEEMADFLNDCYHIMTEDELESAIKQAAHGIKGDA